MQKQTKSILNRKRALMCTRHQSPVRKVPTFRLYFITGGTTWLQSTKDLCFMVMARKSGTVEALTGRTTKKQARDIIDVIAVTLESNVTDMTESNDVYIDMVDVVYSVQCGKKEGQTNVRSKV